MPGAHKKQGSVSQALTEEGSRGVRVSQFRAHHIEGAQEDFQDKPGPLGTGEGRTSNNLQPRNLAANMY